MTIQAMRQAVGALRSAVPAEEINDDDGPEEYDSETRLMLGLADDDDGDDETIELEVNGELVEVPVSQLPEQYRGKPLQPAVLPVSPVPATAIPVQNQAQVQELGQTIEQVRRHLRPPSPPAPELAQTDPEDYTAQHARYMADLTQYQAAEQDVARAQQQYQQQQQQANQQNTANERALLAQHWAEWANPSTAPLVKKKLTEFVTGQGYTPEEAAAIADGSYGHRLTLTFRNAMRSEIIAKSRNKTGKRQRKAPKVGTPGTKKSTDRKTKNTRDRFLRTGATTGHSMAEAAGFLKGEYS